MAIPQLVIANAAYKKYPGGVIVLRAADWLAGARGTLSTEVDTRSCCGTVVRDTQKVTASIYDTDRFGPFTAFKEADDTLTIDLADLPIEPGLRYMLLFSVLVEGDWDVTNEDTIRPHSHQEQFAGACNLAFYFQGDSFTGSDSNPILMIDGGVMPRKIGQYRIVGPGLTYVTNYLDGDEVLHLRAYSQGGTTIEWLLDQVYFIPAWLDQSGGDPTWDPADFAIVGGNASTASALYNLDPADGDPDWIDGADGGDDQGKFTWDPLNFFPQTGFAGSGNEGGGDYQRVADSDDAEYMLRVAPEDFLSHRNTEADDPDAPVISHCYGLHGPWFVPEQTWTLDHFSRTLGDPDENGTDDHWLTDSRWGITPEGFAWRTSLMSGPGGAPGPAFRWGTTAYTDGSRGVLKVGTADTGASAISIKAALGPDLILPGSQQQLGADIRCADAIRISAKFTYDVTNVLADEGSGGVNLWVDLGTATYRLVFEFYVSPGWYLQDSEGTILATGSLPGLTIGFRYEILRYRIRVRIWDATGSEPGTWNFDGFRALGAPSEAPEPYDYGDDLEHSITGSRPMSPALQFNAGHVTMNGFAFVYVDDFEVYNDPIGDADSAFASIERPDGTERGQIEMPDCQHLVYWGTRNWTTFVEDDNAHYLDFSAKAWNAPGAAELQRSQAYWWWFRSLHGRPLVPMNWRSSERKGAAWRWLVGSR